MEDKTRLIREIENAVDSKLTDTILFYMTEYRDIADYYFIADIFCHKCDYLAVKIANELTEADREDEQSSFYLHENEHMFAHLRPVHTKTISEMVRSTIPKISF